MGLLSKISQHVFGTQSNAKLNDKEKKELLRRCYFEVMEERRVLSADPVVAGITFWHHRLPVPTAPIRGRSLGLPNPIARSP